MADRNPMSTPSNPQNSMPQYAAGAPTGAPAPRPSAGARAARLTASAGRGAGAGNAGGMGAGPEDGRGKSGRKLTVIIVIICLLVVAAVVAAIVMSIGNSGFFDDSARSGQAPYKTQEEIEAELNRKVEEGMLNISIASNIQFENGASEGVAYIENVPNNHYVMRVSITDNNTGELLYESGGIKPGEYIEKIALTRELDEGIYDATATFKAYDPTTLEEVGEAAAIVTIDVKG